MTATTCSEQQAVEQQLAADLALITELQEYNVMLLRHQQQLLRRLRVSGFHCPDHLMLSQRDAGAGRRSGVVCVGCRMKGEVRLSHQAAASQSS